MVFPCFLPPQKKPTKAASWESWNFIGSCSWESLEVVDLFGVRLFLVKLARDRKHEFWAPQNVAEVPGKSP